MELINSVFNMDYFIALIANLIIAFLLYKFLEAQIKKYPQWEVPKEAYGVIVTFLVFAFVPVINKVLILFAILFILFMILFFIMTLLSFEVKKLIEKIIK